MNGKQTLRMVLSYVPKDRKSADSLRKVLCQLEGVELVARDVRENKKWQVKVTDELQGGAVFVPLLSQESLQSEWLKHVLGFAFATCRAIVAVRTERNVSIPVHLHGLFWIGIEDALKPGTWDQFLPKLGGRWFPFQSADPYKSPVAA